MEKSNKKKNIWYAAVAYSFSIWRLVASDFSSHQECNKNYAQDLSAYWGKKIKIKIKIGVMQQKRIDATLCNTPVGTINPK